MVLWHGNAFTAPAVVRAAAHEISYAAGLPSPLAPLSPFTQQFYDLQRLDDINSHRAAGTTITFGLVRRTSFAHGRRVGARARGVARIYRAGGADHRTSRHRAGGVPSSRYVRTEIEKTG